MTCCLVCEFVVLFVVCVCLLDIWIIRSLVDLLNGRLFLLVAWLVGWLVSRSCCWSVRCLFGCLAGWLDGCSVDWLLGSMVRWFGGWLVCCFVGCLIG